MEAVNENLENPNKWRGRHIAKDMNGDNRHGHRKWSHTRLDAMETYIINRTLQYWTYQCYYHRVCGILEIN